LGSLDEIASADLDLSLNLDAGQAAVLCYAVLTGGFRRIDE
jgi:hypothetical protein